MNSTVCPTLGGMGNSWGILLAKITVFCCFSIEVSVLPGSRGGTDKYQVPGASGKPSPRLNNYLSLGEGLPDAPLVVCYLYVYTVPVIIWPTGFTYDLATSTPRRLGLRWGPTEMYCSR